MNKEQAEAYYIQALKSLYKKYGSSRNLVIRPSRYTLESNPKAMTPLQEAIFYNQHLWKDGEEMIKISKPYILFNRVYTNIYRWRDWQNSDTRVDIKGFCYLTENEPNPIYVNSRIITGNSGSQYLLTTNDGTPEHFHAGKLLPMPLSSMKDMLFGNHDFAILIEDLVRIKKPFLNWGYDEPWRGEK